MYSDDWVGINYLPRSFVFNYFRNFSISTFQAKWSFCAYPLPQMPLGPTQQLIFLKPSWFFLRLAGDRESCNCLQYLQFFRASFKSHWQRTYCGTDQREKPFQWPPSEAKNQHIAWPHQAFLAKNWKTSKS